MPAGGLGGAEARASRSKNARSHPRGDAVTEEYVSLGDLKAGEPASNGSSRGTTARSGNRDSGVASGGQNRATVLMGNSRELSRLRLGMEFALRE
jgi:hypothetical protein